MNPVKCSYCDTSYPEFQAKCSECGAQLSTQHSNHSSTEMNTPEKKPFVLGKTYLGIFVFLTLLVLSLLVYQTQLTKLLITKNPQEAGEIQHFSQGHESSGGEVKTYRNYYQRAKFAKVLVEFTELRIMMQEYFMMMGKFPNNSSEFEKEFGANSLEAEAPFTRISISENGKIRGELDDSFPKDAFVTLTPTLSKRGSSLKWNCETDLPQTEIGPVSAMGCRSLK